MKEIKLTPKDLNELAHIILKFLNPLKLFDLNEPVKIKLYKNDSVIEVMSEKEKLYIQLPQDACPSCTLFYLQEVITQYITKLLDKNKIKVKVEEEHSYIFFENKKIYEDDLNDYSFIIYCNNLPKTNQ